MKVRAEQESGPTSWLNFTICHPDPDAFADFEVIEVVMVDDAGNAMSGALQRIVLRIFEGNLEIGEQAVFEIFTPYTVTAIE